MDVREHGDAHDGLTLPKALVVAALAFLWLVAAMLLWRTEVPAALRLPKLDVHAYFNRAELERVDDYRRIARPLGLASLGLEVAVLTAFVVAAKPVARAARRVAGGAVPAGVLVGVAASVAVWVAQLPPAAVAHRWDARHGLTRQPWAGWLGDAAIALAVQTAVVALAVLIAMLLTRRLGARWWIGAGPAFALLAVVFAILQPLVIQPLTNTFRPLPDRALARQIEQLAAREGVAVGPVQETNASRQTTQANAYVAGIGPTRRVVLFDTILDGRFTRGEILVVAAHELAHVGRRHIWKGLAWFALIVVPGTAVVAWATNRRGGLGDPAAVPAGLLAALLVFLGTLPLANAVSRRYEAEADWIALRTTHDPRGLIGLEQTFVRTSLAQPDPPAWVTFWFGTHPTPIERIAMARAYAASPGFSGRSRAGS